MDYGDQFWTENFNNALPVKQCKALRITAAGLFFSVKTEYSVKVMLEKNSPVCYNKKNGKEASICP